ncbi:MAG: hypothetical protein JSV09_04290 [Thermoplasmata archaeon]|nr:MAG: hypothetical protein JSV09_04290 [Thermoplasmata archaeon]
MLPLFLILLWLVTRDVKVENLKEFLKKRGIVGVFGGIWAMIPDIDYFLDEPLFRNQLWNDIFFLHSTFDRISPETDLFFAAEILLIFAAMNLLVIAAIVDSFERLNNAIFGKKEEDEDEEEDEEDVR